MTGSTRAARAAALVIALFVTAACGESASRDRGAGATERRDAGSERVACRAGSANCNDDPADGCEVELASDAEHCGACGVDCRLGPCVDGSCGARPEQIGTQGGVCEMVTDGDTVYWADCEIDGPHEVVGFSADGASEAEAIATVTDGMRWVYDMAVDDEAVYWTVPGVPCPGCEDSTPGGIGRFEKSSGVAELVIVEGDVWGLALDDERIYWTRHAVLAGGTKTGAILARTRSGDSQDVLAETPARVIAVDETAIYFDDASNDSIVRLDKAGGVPVPIGVLYGIPYGLAVVDGYVYCADDAGLFRVPVNGGPTEALDDIAGPFTIDAGTLYYQRLRSIVAQRDGEITPLASIRGSAGGIAVAQGYVYFADFNSGGVYRTRL